MKRLNFFYTILAVIFLLTSSLSIAGVIEVKKNTPDERSPLAQTTNNNTLVKESNTEKERIKQAAIESQSPLGQRIDWYYDIKQPLDKLKEDKKIYLKQLIAAKKDFKDEERKINKYYTEINTGKIYFQTDKSTLDENAKKIISAKAVLIKNLFKLSQDSKEISITIWAGADAPGTEKHNFGLTKKRANAVIAELQNNGLPAALFTIASFGEFRFGDLLGELADPKERSVEFIVHDKNENPSIIYYEMLALRLKYIENKINNLETLATLAEHEIQFPYKGVGHVRHGEKGHKHKKAPKVKKEKKEKKS